MEISEKKIYYMTCPKCDCTYAHIFKKEKCDECNIVLEEDPINYPPNSTEWRKCNKNLNERRKEIKKLNEGHIS